MSSFGEYVRKGQDIVNSEDQKARALRQQQQEAMRSQRAREQETAQLASVVRRETGVVTQALISAGVQTDQVACLYPSGRNGTTTRKRERFIAKHSFGVWDMHCTWNYTEQQEPWDSTNHSYYLGRTGQLYYSSRHPDQERTPYQPELVHKWSDWDYESASKLEVARQGLGYLVARYNLSVNL
jgi:hypothetical protein